MRREERCDEIPRRSRVYPGMQSTRHLVSLRARRARLERLWWRSDPGKEPLAIAVGLPVAAQALQQLFADGNLAELISLSPHSHDLPFSIEVTGLEAGAFTQA